MDNTKTTLCASCAKYPREALETGERGLCADYSILRAWDDPATVLHVPAKDRENRRRLVIKLMEQKSNNEKGK